MGLSKASFIVAVLMWEHNRRNIRESCLSMPGPKLAAARAAYGLDAADTSRAARAELATRLLSGKHVWSKDRLAAHEQATKASNAKGKARAVRQKAKP